MAFLIFSAILWMGLIRRIPTEDVILRAIGGGAAGFLIGWLSFGPLGKALLQGAARITEETPPSEPEAPAKAENKPKKEAGT